MNGPANAQRTRDSGKMRPNVTSPSDRPTGHYTLQTNFLCDGRGDGQQREGTTRERTRPLPRWVLPAGGRLRVSQPSLHHFFTHGV